MSSGWDILTKWRAPRPDEPDVLVESSANGGDPSEECRRLGRCARTCSSSGAGCTSSSSLSAPEAIFTVGVESESDRAILGISVDQVSSFCSPIISSLLLKEFDKLRADFDSNSTHGGAILVITT